MDTLNANIDKFYKFKKERYKRLLSKKNELEKQNERFKKTGFKKHLKTFIYYFKKTFTIIFALVLFAVSVMLFIAPEMIIAHEDFNEELMEAFKEEYLKEAGKTLSEAVVEVAQEGFIYEEDAIWESFDLALEKMIMEDIRESLKWFSGLFLLFAILVLFSTRLNKKLRKCNLRLNDTENITKTTINDYFALIEEEAKELKLLEGIIKES
jgi:hypothetical protein